jgi:hypothetical protein
MLILTSELLSRFDNVIFGFSTKIGLLRKAPYYFNLSYSVGDNENVVTENRTGFLKALKFDVNRVVFQKQVHSDIVKIVDEPGNAGECDALITNTAGLGLAVSSADCATIFIYDVNNNVIAGVHSGWRGTQKGILERTLNTLSKNYNSRADDLFIYILPAISQTNYEVGKEVADVFDEKYLIRNNEKFYLDVTGVNLDLLTKFGIPEKNIEVSGLCSYSNDQFLHSYRRDGLKSGRSLGVIVLKES